MKADLERFEEIVARERRRLYLADHANGAKFDKATRRLFALLYHEAFHSYAATFVYPPLPAADVRAGKGTGELPRWLNEGLAQLFEGAVVEGTELRVGLPDAERLEKVQDLLRGKGTAAGLVPVADLLRAGKDSFLAAHDDQRTAADRAYLTSWAITYWLTFDRREVGAQGVREVPGRGELRRGPGRGVRAVGRNRRAVGREGTARLLCCGSGWTGRSPRRPARRSRDFAQPRRRVRLAGAVAGGSAG